MAWSNAAPWKNAAPWMEEAAEVVDISLTVSLGRGSYGQLGAGSSSGRLERT